MNVRTRRVALVAATSLVSAGMLVPQANAAPTKVKGGQTTLTLTAKAKKLLKKRHIKLVAMKPGKAKGRTYILRTTTGKYDFGNNRGTVNQGGSLRFKKGKRVVKITAISVTLGKSSKVVAKVAGRKMTLGKLVRNKQKVKSSAANRSVSGIKVQISKAAAKRINKRLRGHAFKGSQLGTMSVRVHRPKSAAGTGTTVAPTDNTSAAKIGFAPGVSQALADNGLAPSALPGANMLPDGTLSLPVTGVNIDPATGKGTVDLTGGFTLGSGDNAITVDNPQLVVNGDQSGLYAAVNGTRVKIAALEGTGLAEALKSGTKQLSDLLIQLSPEAAAALNQAGGVSVFLPGTPFGDLSVSLPSS
jgi:hypothetical protein